MDDSTLINGSNKYLQDTLLKVANGESTALEPHLAIINKNVLVDKTTASLHAYSFQVDANGNIRWKALVDFLVTCRVDYAIPKRKIAEAHTKDLESGNNTEMTRLADEARGLFADVTDSGEGGEILLYALATNFLNFPQAICKMSLKTNPNVYIHGSDGIYLEGCEDGGLNLYWGESKIYAQHSAAFSECFKSLKPFLLGADSNSSPHHRDLMLLNEHMNLDDGQLEKLVKSYIDPNNPSSLKLHHCGLALIGFDSDIYQPSDNVSSDLMTEFGRQFDSWQSSTKRQIDRHQLQKIQMHVFCIPMHSVAEFRECFANRMGLQVGGDAAA